MPTDEIAVAYFTSRSTKIQFLQAFSVIYTEKNAFESVVFLPKACILLIQKNML